MTQRQTGELAPADGSSGAIAIVRWSCCLLLVAVWAAAGWWAGVTGLLAGYQASLHGADLAAWATQPLLAWVGIGVSALALTWLTWLGAERTLDRSASLALLSVAIGVLVVLVAVFAIAAAASGGPLRGVLTLPDEWLIPGAAWSAGLWRYLPAVVAPALGIVALGALLAARAARLRPAVQLVIAGAAILVVWLAFAIGYPLLLAGH